MVLRRKRLLPLRHQAPPFLMFLAATGFRSCRLTEVYALFPRFALAKKARCSQAGTRSRAAPRGPRRKGEWALCILTHYLGDEDRAADLHNDFAALTIRRFTADWELNENDIDNALMEVEILRARWRIALARG
jgi:hypothetical protein